MPIYEYRTESGRTFEVFVRRADDATETAVDPKTGEVGTRIISGAGFAFKGSGFYLTDYGKNAHRTGSAPAKPSDASSAGGKADAPASSGGDASAGASSAPTAPAAPATPAPSSPTKKAGE